MNWLDKAIEWVAPEEAYKRQVFRRSIEAERNYDAASYKRPNGNWRVLNESAEQTDRFSRDTVRARARDLERNSDVMNAVLGAYKRNIFGSGYKLRPGTGDSELDKKISDYWKIWCKKQNCDVTGTQSLNAIMRMVIQRKRVDGGVFLVKRYISGDLVPFKLQILEVDELDTTFTSPHEKGNRVVGGVEYNAWNKMENVYLYTIAEFTHLFVDIGERCLSVSLLIGKLATLVMRGRHTL